MRANADRGTVIQFTRIRFRISDQFIDRIHWNAGVDDQRTRVDRGQGNGRQQLRRIEIEIEQNHLGHKRARYADRHERVAIGRCTDHLLECDRTPCATLVFDQNRLAEDRGRATSNQPCGSVGGTTSRKRHHKLDRAVRECAGDTANRTQDSSC